MSRRPCNFRESDVKRAIRAVQAAGRPVARVEIEAGKIVVIPEKLDQTDTLVGRLGVNEWDEVADAG